MKKIYKNFRLYGRNKLMMGAIQHCGASPEKLEKKRKIMPYLSARLEV